MFPAPREGGGPEMSPAEQPPRAAGERRPGVRGASPQALPGVRTSLNPPRSQSENLAARAGGNKQANISNNPASCCFHSVGTDMTLNTDADKEVRVLTLKKAYFHFKKAYFKSSCQRECFSGHQCLSRGGP